METIQLEATVKSIRKDKTAAQLSYIDEETGEERAEWFSLAEAVQNFVKVGKCNVKITLEQDEETGNRIILFFQSKAVTTAARPQAGGLVKKPSTPRPMNSAVANGETMDNTNEAMNRMSALKNAGMIYEGSGKEDEFKRLTEEILEFINKGIWITRVKVGVTKNETEPVKQGELSE